MITAARHALPITAPGLTFNPVAEATLRGIVIRVHPSASDLGDYSEEERAITIRGGSWEYLRTTATYRLAHVVLGNATLEEAVVWAAERLIAEDDLQAIASAVDDPLVWATVLRVRPCLLAAYLKMRAGLPTALATHVEELAAA